MILMADKHQIQQALIALFVNAVEAMPDGGSLAVHVGKSPTAEEIHIRVSDTGIGIAPDDISHIFEPFFTRKRTVTEPVWDYRSSMALWNAMAARSLSHRKSAKEQHSCFRSPLIKNHNSKKQPKRSGMKEQSSILIIDDERVVRESLTKWFEEDGYTVGSAANAADALRLLQGQKWQIILLDIRMPGMDGIELQPRIKQVDPNALIIFITAHASVDTAVQALKAGAFD